MLQVLDANGSIVNLRTDTVDGQIVVSSKDVPSGQLANYLSKFAVDPADSNNKNANGNYSSTAAEFTLQPPPGTTYYVTRLCVHIVDSGSFDSGSYGNGISLSNGITVGVYSGAALQLDLTDGFPIIRNPDWGRFCYDAGPPSTYGSGNESLSIRWTFSKGNTLIKLVGDNNESIKVVLNDNFSGLIEHTFMFQGYTE